MSGPWEVGQHPAIARGWIVKPVLFGSHVRVLPECEGGHVLLLDEADARLIAAAPEMLDALEYAVADMAYGEEPALDQDGQEFDPFKKMRAAIARAKGEAS